MAAIPELNIEFFAFANVNNTIRLRNGRLLVRLSDLLEGAPDAVLRAIAHILLAKMYRQPIDRGQAARYRKYVASHEIVRKTHLVRQIRGRKLLRPARGHSYDLDTIFEQLNIRFFHGLMARPRMSWSQAKDATHSGPLRPRAQCDHHQPHLRPSRDAGLCAGVHRLSRDAPFKTSSTPSWKQAVCSLPGVSGGGKTISSHHRGKCISEKTLKSIGRCNFVHENQFGGVSTGLVTLLEI